MDLNKLENAWIDISNPNTNFLFNITNSKKDSYSDLTKGMFIDFLKKVSIKPLDFDSVKIFFCDKIREGLSGNKYVEPELTENQLTNISNIENFEFSEFEWKEKIFKVLAGNFSFEEPNLSYPKFQIKQGIDVIECNQPHYVGINRCYVYEIVNQFLVLESELDTFCESLLENYESYLIPEKYNGEIIYVEVKKSLRTTN